MSMMMQTARAPFRASSSQGDPGLLDWARSSLSSVLKFTPLAPLSDLVTGPRRPRLVGPARNGPQEVPKPGTRGRIERFLPGGETGMMACASGFRPNKTSYFLKDGTHVEAGSRCVKRRQRNPLNPKAMSRAIGRIDGGKRFQNRMAQISTGKFTASGKRRSCG